MQSKFVNIAASWIKVFLVGIAIRFLFGIVHACCGFFSSENKRPNNPYSPLVAFVVFLLGDCLFAYVLSLIFNLKIFFLVGIHYWTAGLFWPIMVHGKAVSISRLDRILIKINFAICSIKQRF